MVKELRSLYPYKIYLVIGDDKTQAKFFNQYGVKWCGWYGALAYVTPLEFKDQETQVAILSIKDKGIETTTLFHECLHLVILTFEYIEMKLNNDTSEAATYFQVDLFNQVMDAIK